MKNKYIIKLVDGTKIKIGNNRDDFSETLNYITRQLEMYPNVFINLNMQGVTDKNYCIKGNSVIAIYEDDEKEIINE